MLVSARLARACTRDSPVVTTALAILPVFGLVAFVKLWPSPVGGVIAVSEAGVLSAPGKYVLADDIASSATSVISVAANSVELDLNGKTISCIPEDAADTYGINVVANRDVTIRNGAIKNCVMGVRAGWVDNLTITDVDFSETRYVGAAIGGNHVRVTGSVFSRIGGYTKSAYAVGVRVASGSGNCVIERNVFEELYRQASAAESEVGEGVAIIVGSEGDGCRIHQNTIINEKIEKHSIGMWVGEAATADVTNNVVIGFERGIVATGSIDAMENIVWLRSPLDQSYGVYAQSGSAAENLVIGYANPVAPALASSSNVIQQSPQSR